MEKEFIRQIQKKIIELLRQNNSKLLYISSKDSCSEIARLVGCWIIEKIPKAKVLILKGDNILNTNKSHDIIAAEINDKLDLIDPTIWQFFKNRRSIFIKQVGDIENGLIEAHKIYGGRWVVSEELNTKEHDKKALEKIISLNIKGRA